jgi:hypothetical protein
VERSRHCGGKIGGTRELIAVACPENVVKSVRVAFVEQRTNWTKTKTSGGRIEADLPRRGAGDRIGPT